MKYTLISILILILMLLGSFYLKAQNRFSTFKLKASQLSSEKTIWVYTPKSYLLKKRRKYPVVYMHDGQNLMDEKTAFAGTWKICETLDSLNLEVIVIGIAHGNEKRLEELTPFPHPKYGGGKADDYLKFVFETLKPYVDENYRTKSDKQNTLMMGSSLGGLVTFYAGMKYQNQIGKIGVFSPSFWFSDEIYVMAKNQRKWQTKTYFMCGDAESENLVDEVEKMVQIVHEKATQKENIKVKIVPEGKHQEWLWAQEFGEAIQWLVRN